MNTRRYKSYVFNDLDLYEDGFDAEDMALFFKQLPKDAKIVRWGHYIERAQAFFIVEHESFEVVPDNLCIPETPISFDALWKKNNEERGYYSSPNYVVDNSGMTSKRVGYISNEHLKFEDLKRTKELLFDELYKNPSPTETELKLLQESINRVSDEINKNQTVFGTGILKIKAGDGKVNLTSIYPLEDTLKPINDKTYISSDWYHSLDKKKTIKNPQLDFSKWYFAFCTDEIKISKNPEYLRGINGFIPETHWVEPFETGHLEGTCLEDLTFHPRVQTPDTPAWDKKIGLKEIHDQFCKEKGIKHLGELNLNTKQQNCEHDWATYDSGFTTKFDYCRKCDVKRKEE